MKKILKLAHFKDQKEIYPLVRRFFEQEKARILTIVPRADVEHVGASSIPGAITLGDLDIQIRVDQEYFQKISRDLCKFYYVNHPELWTDKFALFHWKDHPEIPMSIMVTVINSPDDEFSKQRDLFINNPSLLEKYNALKRTYEGRDLNEYKKAKMTFFGGPNGAKRSLRIKNEQFSDMLGSVDSSRRKRLPRT